MRRLIIGITSPISVILIKGQLKYFAERGYQVYLMAPIHPDVGAICREENAVHLPVNFTREISLFQDFITLGRVIYLFMKIRPHIVNVGTPKAALLGIIAAKTVGIRRRVYTCRGFRFEHERGLKRKILVAMERVTGYFATDIICISRSIKTMAVKEGVFREKKCAVIGNGSSNGIDLSTFNPRLTNEGRMQADRDRLQIRNRFVFGFVGRLIDRKGIAELIIAFSKLKVKYPDIVLLLVGHAEIDQLSDRRIVEDIANNPDIISLGWQADVARYLTLMDVFVLPAWWEGFGNVLIQAAAMGVPVISTKATGTEDAVADGFNGTLVQPRDTGSLLISMENYYRNSELRRSHGQNGIKWASQFDSHTIWAGMEKIYNGE